jgi:hypothetical protein
MSLCRGLVASMSLRHVDRDAAKVVATSQSGTAEVQVPAHAARQARIAAAHPRGAHIDHVPAPMAPLEDGQGRIEPAPVTAGRRDCGLRPRTLARDQRPSQPKMSAPNRLWEQPRSLHRGA